MPSVIWDTIQHVLDSMAANTDRQSPYEDTCLETPTFTKINRDSQVHFLDFAIIDGRRCHKVAPHSTFYNHAPNSYGRRNPLHVSCADEYGYTIRTECFFVMNSAAIHYPLMATSGL